MASFEGEDDFEPYTADNFTETEDTTFGEMALPDGTYAMIYEMRDAMNNYALFRGRRFVCKNGENLDLRVKNTIYFNCACVGSVKYVA